MHKPSLSQIVYTTLFPRPRSTDPTSFSAHVARNLVPEVRIETSTFYGSLDCIEAQYPGLDYSYGPHRMRLSRFPHHRKLFKVFDDLGLTQSEIGSICRWEGTKSARERYEKEESVVVRDTTGENIRQAPPSPPPSIQMHFGNASTPTTRRQPVDRALPTHISTQSSRAGPEDSDESSSDEEMQSCGVPLNRRLIIATAARERGADVPLDEDWEQWLKDAVERGSYSDILSAIRSGRSLNFLSSSASSSTTPVSRSVGTDAGAVEPRLQATDSALVATLSDANSTLRTNFSGTVR